MDHGSWFGGMGWFMWIFVVGIPLTLIIGIYMLLSSERRVSEDPLDILNKRYANGDISREEFERMKRDIDRG